MYAIVEIAGQQYKVKKDQQIFVHRLEGKEGSKVTFDQVLLTDDGKNIEVGAPAVKGVSVSAKIIEHLKGDKVIVFKKKRRKGYQVRNGHRQQFSKIEIDGIGAVKPASKTAVKKDELKTETKKAEPKKAEPKKADAKKTEPKKEAKKSAPKAPKSSTSPKTKAKAETVKTKASAKPKTEKKAKTASDQPKAAAKPKTAAKPKANSETKAEKTKKEDKK